MATMMKQQWNWEKKITLQEKGKYTII